MASSSSGAMDVSDNDYPSRSSQIQSLIVNPNSNLAATSSEPRASSSTGNYDLWSDTNNLGRILFYLFVTFLNAVLILFYALYTDLCIIFKTYINSIDGESRSRSTNIDASKLMCRKYMVGRCKKARKCQYSHSMEHLPTSFCKDYIYSK